MTFREYFKPSSEPTVVSSPVEPEPWRSSILQNLWVNIADYNPAGYYRHEGRVHLRGRIGGGVVVVGTALFPLAAGYRPANKESLPARSDAGPVQVEVSLAGVASIGDGSFKAGSQWLSLDGLSFRVLTGRYPGQNRYPNTNRYPMGG